MTITAEKMIEFLLKQPSDSKILIEDSNGESSEYLSCNHLLHHQSPEDTIQSPNAEPLLVSEMITFLQTRPADANVIIETAEGGAFEALTSESLYDAWERDVTNDPTKTEHVILLSNYKEVKN